MTLPSLTIGYRLSSGRYTWHIDELGMTLVHNGRVWVIQSAHHRAGSWLRRTGLMHAGRPSRIELLQLIAAHDAADPAPRMPDVALEPVRRTDGGYESLDGRFDIIRTGSGNWEIWDCETQGFEGCPTLRACRRAAAAKRAREQQAQRETEARFEQLVSRGQASWAA